MSFKFLRYLLALNPLPRRTVLVLHKTFIARRGRGCRCFRYPRLRYAHLGLLRVGLSEAAAMAQVKRFEQKHVLKGHPLNNPR